MNVPSRFSDVVGSEYPDGFCLVGTGSRRHWVESNDVEHVVERFKAFVRSHSRCGDLILLDAFDFGGGRQNQIDFQPLKLQNGFQGGIIC